MQQPRTWNLGAGSESLLEAEVPVEIAPDAQTWGDASPTYTSSNWDIESSTGHNRAYTATLDLKPPWSSQYMERQKGLCRESDERRNSIRGRKLSFIRISRTNNIPGESPRPCCF